jgi:hypothetical protein
MRKLAREEKDRKREYFDRDDFDIVRGRWKGGAGRRQENPKPERCI